MKKIMQAISSIIIISMLAVMTFPVAGANAFTDGIGGPEQKNEQIENGFVGGSSDTSEGSQQTRGGPNEQADVPEEPEEPERPGDIGEPEGSGEPEEPVGSWEPEGPVNVVPEIPVPAMEMRKAANALQAANEDILKALISAAPANDELYEIEVTKDIHLTSSIVVQDHQNIKIYSEDSSIFELTTDNVRHFEVEGTLALGSIVLDGESALGGVHVNGGELIMNEGASIENCITGIGGGVYVIGGIVSMEGGSIQNNKGIGTAGGIYATTNSALYIRSGNISGNESKNGGGIYLDSGSSAFMSGGTVGGAAEAEGNKAELYGGGVFVHDGSTFVMDGGSIEGNRKMPFAAGGGGGGVYVYKGSSFELKNGTIKNNIAEVSGNSFTYGGGIMLGSMVFVSPSPAPNSLIMSGGFIEGNSSGPHGGGVALVGNGEFIMTDGTISGNNTLYYGGGVYIGDPYKDTTVRFTMSGGSIMDNRAMAGGGVMIASKKIADRNTVFNMDGGLICGNESTTSGGGVYVINENSRFNVGQNWDNSLSIPTIEGNTAAEHGGGMYSDSALTTIYKGVVKDNQAALDGGGICLENGAELEMENAQISGNIAGGAGGGICLAEDAELAINGNTSLTDNTSEGYQGGAIYSDLFKFYDENMNVSYDYSNLSITGDTIFSGNQADGLYYPPKNANSFTNLGFAQRSMPDVVSHVLNNYDINYAQDPEIKVYKIIYNANDETATPAAVQFEVFAGGSHKVKENTDPAIGFTRDQYTFTGWNSLADGQGTGYPVNTDVTDIRGDIILYAQWEKDVTFTVTYDANGGKGSFIDSGLKLGDSYTVKAASETGIENLSKPFVSWNTQQDGKGMSYVPQSTFTIKEDVTLYAQWGTPGSGLAHTVTYDANGGKGSHQDSGLLSGAPYTVKNQSEAGITHSGYTFTGWNTQQDGKGTAYAPRDTFSITGSMTLYAQWKKDGGGGNGGGGGKTTYTVTYDANGGEGSYKDSGLSAGAAYRVKTQAATGIAYKGHNFTGWNIQQDGKGAAYDPADTFIISRDVTLYAQWQTEEALPQLNKEDHLAYIVGYPDKTVRPNNNITRAETAAVFFRLLTEESRSQYWSRTNSYYDVAANDWFNTAVSTMSSADIITGYEDGSFGGGRYITRAEFAVIAARFDNAGYTGPDKFSDINMHWAKEYINQAVENGWITGYEDGTFKPDQYISRAEAMSLVNCVLEREKIKEMHPDMVTWTDNLSTAWYYAAVQEATNSHAYARDAGGSEIWTEVLHAPDWAALELY